MATNNVQASPPSPGSSALIPALATFLGVFFLIASLLLVMFLRKRRRLRQFENYASHPSPSLYMKRRPPSLSQPPPPIAVTQASSNAGFLPIPLSFAHQRHEMPGFGTSGRRQIGPFSSSWHWFGGNHGGGARSYDNRSSLPASSTGRTSRGEGGNSSIAVGNRTLWRERTSDSPGTESAQRESSGSGKSMDGTMLEDHSFHRNGTLNGSQRRGQSVGFENPHNNAPSRSDSSRSTDGKESSSGWYGRDGIVTGKDIEGPSMRHTGRSTKSIWVTEKELEGFQRDRRYETINPQAQGRSSAPPGAMSGRSGWASQSTATDRRGDIRTSVVSKWPEEEGINLGGGDDEGENEARKELQRVFLGREMHGQSAVARTRSLGFSNERRTIALFKDSETAETQGKSKAYTKRRDNEDSSSVQILAPAALGRSIGRRTPLERGLL